MKRKCGDLWSGLSSSLSLEHLVEGFVPQRTSVPLEDSDNGKLDRGKKIIWDERVHIQGPDENALSLWYQEYMLDENMRWNAIRWNAEVGMEIPALHNRLYLFIYSLFLLFIQLRHEFEIIRSEYTNKQFALLAGIRHLGRQGHSMISKNVCAFQCTWWNIITNYINDF